MAVGPVQCRWMLTVCGVLVVAVALVVAAGVIPPVRVAISPDITPQSAVPAFWVSVGLQLLAALVLLLTAVLSKRRSWISTSALIVTGVLVLFLGFALGDAAIALHETGMQTVTTLLFLCVAADALAGAVIVATALLRPPRTRETLAHAST